MSTIIKTEKQISDSTAMQTLAQYFVDMLEQGIANGTPMTWRKPWGAMIHSQAQSGATGKPYTGANQFWLGIIQAQKGYKSVQWITAAYAQKMCMVPREGEIPTPIFQKFSGKKKIDGFIIDDNTGEPKDNPTFISMKNIRVSYVFNLDQFDFVYPTVAKREPAKKVFDTNIVRIADADEIIQNFGIEIKHGGNSACYSPALDIIKMPEEKQFVDTAAYYATMFHEVAHSTGHGDRLNRKGITQPIKFGSEQYAREELIAEFTAAFCCQELNIENETLQENHAAYFSSWLKVLKESPRLILDILNDAYKAYAYIFGMDSVEIE